MDGERKVSSAELEQLLLRRRRQEAVEGLRSLLPQSSPDLPPGDSSQEDALAATGLGRPVRIVARRAPIVAAPSHQLLAESVPVAATEGWLRQLRPRLHPRLPKRTRRRSHPVIRVVKRGLDRVLDVLVPVMLVLVIVYMVLAAPSYLGWLVGRDSNVEAQGPSPWTLYGQRRLGEVQQAPLPYVPYSSTVELQAPFVPVPTSAPGKDEPTRLIIQSIQVDTPVKEVSVEGGAWQVAEYAAGYHRGTARPGTVGNTVISGHKGMSGAVFARLEEVNPGDEVLLYAGTHLYRYIVDEKKSVWPTDTYVMYQTSTPILTLITCTAYDTQRLVVVAHFDKELNTEVENGP